MNDDIRPFNQNELSAEDLEVLRVFHILPEHPAQADPLSNQPYESQSSTSLSGDEMLVLFTTEVSEEIATMRLALQQLEQDDRVDSPAIFAMKRTAHKVAGTAAAIGCDSISTIARHMETVIKLVEDGTVVYLTGLIALVHAVRALESTSQSITDQGYESKNPLLDLEEEYKALNIDVHVTPASERLSPQNTGETLAHLLETQAASPAARIDPRYLDTLIQHTEKLIELRTPLENAQKQVETALYELHAAQARLRRLEPLLSTLSVSLNTVTNAMVADAALPSSSLVARILQEAVQRTGHTYYQSETQSFLQPLLAQETALWDEMEIDRFTETNVLAHSLTEAIADVATATSQVQLAFAHLNSVVERQADQASVVRSDALLLRSAPFSILVTRLQQAVAMMTRTQKAKVQFAVSGEAIEIDQDILETLVNPLLALVQSSVADGLFFARRSERDEEQQLRIWLNAHAIGNEVSIEMGFSLPFSPGAIVALQETVHLLYGSISLQDQAAEGITLRLRFPRSQRVIQGLLVRAGSQRVIVPFSQVQRVRYNIHETGDAHSQGEHPRDALLAGIEIYRLNTLLGFFAEKNPPEKTLRTALLVELGNPPVAVEVDEVVGEVELVMKPLAAYLRRPGIAATAIDGSGSVLLVVNLPEMIKLQEIHHRSGKPVTGTTTSSYQEIPPPQQAGPRRRRILIADDSVYMRRSISLTLSHEGYDALEAEDGLQALEQLSKESLDLLLLDIEMPNLNGYDVLNIIRVQQRFPGLKIVLLTSRSSEKHKQRALESGAHAYLTKPCPQDLLLETIQSLLAP